MVEAFLESCRVCLSNMLLWWDLLYVHVIKGHIPRSKVIRGQVVRWAQNVKFTSFEKLEVRLEPNLDYWYNVGTFTCSWGHRSQMKVKGHVRSIFRRAWKCKIWLICILEDQLEPGDPNRWGVNLHHPHTATVGDTSGPGTAKYFCLHCEWCRVFPSYVSLKKKWKLDAPKI